MNRGISIIFIKLILASSVIGLQTKQVPRSWKVCRQSEKQIEKCIKEACEVALRSLAKGSPDLGLPPLDPLTIKSLNISVVDTPQDGPFSFKMSLSDIRSAGLTRMRISNVRQDWKKLLWVINASLDQPQVVEGKYKVNGRVLLLPVTGEGKIRLVFHSFNASLVMNLKRVKKGNVEFANVDKFDVNFTTSKMTIRMDNLFNGNKALGDNLNIVINEHWKELFKELYPSLRTQLKDRIKLYPAKIFDQIPFNELAPR